MLFRPR